MRLTQAQKIAADTAVDCSKWSDEQLNNRVVEITKTLAGSFIGQLERLGLHEDRKAMRAEIARRATKST